MDPSTYTLANFLTDAVSLVGSLYLWPIIFGGAAFLLIARFVRRIVR